MFRARSRQHTCIDNNIDTSLYYVMLSERVAPMEHARKSVQLSNTKVVCFSFAVSVPDGEKCRRVN